MTLLKKLLPVPIIILTGTTAYSQLQSGNLYGVAIYYKSVNDYSAGFAGFDPLAGTSSGINQIYSGINFAGPDHPSIDAINKRCFLEFNPNFYEPMHLLTLDLETGITIYDVEVQSLGDTAYWIDKVFYNPADHLLYAIYTNNHPYDSVQLVTIDPASGILTPVFKLSPTVYFSFNGFDSEDQIIYGLYQAEAPKKYLVAIDLVHHKESRILITPEVKYNYGFILAFNCNDGSLYGIRFGFVGSEIECKIVRINPLTGKTDDLLPLPQYYWKEDIAIDPVKQKMYAFGGKDKSSGNFCTYDMAANTASFVEYHGASLVEGISFDIYSPKEPPHADFESSNFCLKGVTQFTSSPNSNATFYYWNFDDPASQDNTSTLANPAHIFTHAGDYAVELIVTSCQGSDTLIQQITIDDFPPVDIGPDTTVCTNSLSPVVLNSSVPGNYNVTWSTGENTPAIEVTAPGVYWVKLSASCGSVSDTVTVEGKLCDCGIHVYPDLTSDQLTIDIDCDVRNFPGLHLTLYNMLGQALQTLPLSDENLQLKFQGLSSGMYVVRLEDDHHVITAQKVVFMK